MYNLEGKVQKNLSNNETNFIVDNNCVVVCPWVIRNGFQNISENGFLPANADPYWYGYFQKIFTGNQVITATWEDSTYLTKVPDEYKFAYNFQTGKFYKGAVVVGTAEYSTEIEPMQGNEDFLSMKNNSSVVIRFQDWVPSEKDMYKLYTIPDLYGGKWYYISSVKVLNDLQTRLGRNEVVSFNDTSIPAVEVTFTSLVDKLQVSGKAVEQYVQYAGVGEPYIIPLVTEYNENYGESATDRQFIEPKKYVSYIPYEPTSANYLQVELQGCNAISAVEVEGRSLTYQVIGQDEEGNDVYGWASTPWKRLLAHDTVANQVNELNRTSLPSRNFYYFPDSNVDFVTSKQFQEDNKTREDALAMNQSAGKLRLGAYQESGEHPIQDWTNLANGLHKSNPATTDGTHYDYNNKNWFPTSWTGRNWNFDTNGNFYAENTISIKPTDTFVDIINKNSFIYETQPLIPLGFVSSKPYHISSIPIIGKIVSKFWGDMTINPHTTQRQPLNLGLFIDCDVAGMLANIYNSRQDNSVWCPLNALCGDETKASKYLGTTALNTTLCFSLTDKVKEQSTVYDTIYFGQTKDENNQYILANHKPYYYGRENQVTEPKDANAVFVIDTITVYALHKGKIKLTAYNTLENPIWTTTIQSKANWTNSIRDWATTIMTGGWEEDYCDFSVSDFPWPERPDKSSGYEISINHNTIERLQDKAAQRPRQGVAIYDQSIWKNGFSGYSQYDGKLGIKATRPTKSTTITTPYIDIDASITSKQDFKNRFKQFTLLASGVIEVDGSSLKTKENQITIDIGTSDTYTGTYIIGQLGGQVTGSTIPILAKDDSEQAKNNVRQAITNHGGGAVSSTTTDAGFSTCFTYTVTLNDSNVTVVIDENNYWTGWGKDKDDVYFGETVKNMITNRPNQTIWMSFTNVLTYEVKVPKLKLIEREIELVGGSTRLIAINGTAGQDTGTWTATLGSQTLPVYLYDAPTGVTINNGKVQWNNSVAIGNYTFYVYAINPTTQKPIYQEITMLVTTQDTLNISLKQNIEVVITPGVTYQTFFLIDTATIGATSIKDSLTASNVSITATFVEGTDNYTFEPLDKGRAQVKNAGIAIIVHRAKYNLSVTVTVGGRTATATTTCRIY